VSYVIKFTPPGSTLTAIAAVDYKFCAEAGTFGDTCTLPAGMTLSTTSASSTGFNGAGGASAGAYSTQGATILRFVPTVPATETAIVHTTTFPAMTNPNAQGTYYMRARTYSDGTASTPIDNGTSTFAIVNAVTVSGTVLENLTFTVAAVTSGACGSGGSTVTATTATATTIPLGNFQSGTPRVGCHAIKTATNAVGGYTTTFKHVNGGTAPQGGMCRQTATNCASTGGNAGVSATDVIGDTVLNTTPAAWTNATTFGFGLNANGAQADSAFSGAANFRSTFGTGFSVATNASNTAGVDTHITYQIDVPANQIAGVYQNQVEYITTPTY
jgi:hypothetical protein